VTRLQQDWQAANRALQTAAGRAEALTARQEALRERLDGRPDRAGIAAALAEIDRAEQDQQAADRTLREARRARDAAVRADREATARLAAARAELDAARDPLVALGAPPPERADLVADWLALAEWALAAGAEREGRSTAAATARTRARDELAEREQELRAELVAHGVELDGRRPLAEAAEPAVAAAEGRARSTAARIAERRAEAAALRATVTAAEEEASVAKLLGQLLRADGFERWLLTSALDVLVADASATLLELSGGQFELTHDGKDFAVVDHADADSVRPVRTLSGGETFQASLALALALSAQLAGLAGGGTARLDAIVLDEGFGTLDEATLDVVASTLESLAATGERMVGVVTHVGALAERVPVRFSVTRTASGSTVERQDA
jgi:exonuclease SbcC